ncbi:MAG TPA: hypothetical protein VKM55_02640 [Candidatus Lokiarchaeia archaeon]|nr:hypothetical protein [Candidatus Lokiarchaeia archaeon]
MPMMLALLKWDPVAGISIYAKYGMADSDLTQDQANSIFMSHASGKKPAPKLALQLEDMSIASKFMERKNNKTVDRLILVLVLNSGEKAENFYDDLDALESTVWENIGKPQIKMNMIIQEAFVKLTSQVISEIDAESIRKRAIKRAQDLLDSNQIDKAQRLLSNSKTQPDELVAAADEGLRLRNEKKYDESARSYNDAKDYAESLQEPELADEFGKQAARSTEIPVLEKSREKMLKLARDYMKKEEFLNAASKFKEASELSEKLGDIVGKEINGKKSALLFQYAEIDGMSE